MIDRLFYIIYNSYYKHGNYKNDIPPLTVFGLFAVALFSLGLCFIYAHYLVKDPDHFIKHQPISGKTVWMIGSLFLTYFLFYYNKRYKKIYEKYKHITAYDSVQYKVIAFIIIFTLICSTIIMGLVYNKLHFGWWV